MTTSTGSPLTTIAVPQVYDDETGHHRCHASVTVGVLLSGPDGDDTAVGLMVSEDMTSNAPLCKLLMDPAAAQAVGWLLIKHAFQAQVPYANDEDLEAVSGTIKRADVALATLGKGGRFKVMTFGVSDEDD